MTNVEDRLREAARSLGQTRAAIPPFKAVRQRARRRRMMGAAGAVVVLVAVTVAGVSTTRDRGRVLVANPGSTSTTLAPTTTITTTTLKAPVTLSKVAIYLVANEHVVAAGREVEGAATPEAAVRALLAGPLGKIEGDLGFTSAIPAGTVLHSVTVDGSVATVDLSRQFESGGGSLSMQARVAQVVFTVTQFPNIDHVRFQLDGAPVATIGGEGLMVDNVDRAAFAGVTPLILVESPTPGQTVGAPLHVRGMSNTFEATVNYTLTDSSGAVLAEGFTMATSGSGTWGTFAHDIAFRADHAGPGHLSVYEVSAKDGSRVHETTVPVELQP
jgi:germination protein M